jgi:hypothetical protein
MSHIELAGSLVRTVCFWLVMYAAAYAQSPRPTIGVAHTHAGVGLVMDTLVGPFVLGSGIGLDGGWRTFVGIGRILR